MHSSSLLIVYVAGQNTHVLLSILMKHLDHKNVLEQPNMQLDIVEITTSLALHAKVEPSVAIIGALSDAMRHLRKSIHCSLDDANLGTDVIKWNKCFREEVDKCLVQLSYKVVIFYSYWIFFPLHIHYPLVFWARVSSCNASSLISSNSLMSLYKFPNSYISVAIVIELIICAHYQK